MAVVRYAILGELSVDAMTAEERALTLKMMAVVQGQGTPEAIIAAVDAMDDETVRSCFGGGQPQEAADEAADEAAEESVEEAEEEEIDRYALAEKLGIDDYDEYLKNKELEEDGEDEIFINVATYSQYTNTTEAGQDHAVTIVGWDDNYSAKNFLKDKQPPADGAWIVRNSWA